jgi:dihydropteroate synthase
MAIVNLTDDSFSGDGFGDDASAALERAARVLEDGADIIDVGAESTRPGADTVEAEDEWQRLRPVLKALSGRVRIPLSIDTYKAEVARRALDTGVAMVDDVSGLSYDAGLGAVVAARGAALVLMHTRGRSRDMYIEARYDDVVSEVSRELQRSVERAVGAGVSWERIVIDPGLGFAKQASHSMTALAATDRFASLGRPILVGASRKSFLTSATGPLPAPERDWATSAAVTASVLGGAHIVRVHRVREMIHVVRVADAIRNAVPH